MKDLYIFGAGFLDVVKLVEAINRCEPTWHIRGFIDDAVNLQGQLVSGYPVLGGNQLLTELVEDKNAFFFNNVTTWSTCMKVTEMMASIGCRFANLIHPAVDMNYVETGHNCIIGEGCSIGGRVKMGSFVKMRLNAVVSHDARVEDYAVIGPGAVVGSSAVIKKGALVGAGATVMLKKSIGEYSIVGAGAVVTTDVPACKVVAGVPAKIIKNTGD